MKVRTFGQMPDEPALHIQIQFVIMVQTSIFVSFKNYLGDSSLVKVLTDIREGRYEPPVLELRKKLSDGDKDGAEQIKKGLPAFTVSATYKGRRTKAHLTGYNPLLILDLDGLQPGRIDGLKLLIEGEPYTVACFRSPSGNGLKAIAWNATGLPLDPANHRKGYDCIKAHYERVLGVEIDASGSDAGRLCFVSYDSALYISPRFEAWLNGSGQLPDDIPVLPPVPSGKSLTSVSSLFARAKRRTICKYKYADGSRNNYVHLFAWHCNRLGVPKEETDGYCQVNFGDLPAEELRQAVASAYSHAEEQGKDNGGGRPGKKVERVREYLSEHFYLRKNVVRGLVEYRQKKKKGYGYLPVTDYWENSVWSKLQLDGCRIKQSEVHAVVHSDFSREYNPFTAYFENLPPWDGVTDHIARLAATVRTCKPEFWTACLRKWLVAAVACAIDDGQENHSVLLLSGEQGIGKTTWFRRLVPPALSAYVFSGNVDPSSKDALFLLSDCFLILLDELSGQSRMELNRLKAMITKDAVRERRAYARNAEVYVRRASFVATVNDSQVLTDRTGSRRFLCFEAQAIDYSTPVDHAGVYAQALALYRGGFKFWFSDTDITDLNVNNEAFQQSSPEEELFYTYFRRPERFDVPLFLSSSEIMAKISLYARLAVTGTNVNNIGKLLTRDDFEYKIRKGRRLFAVVELTFEQVKARQMGISGDDAGEGCETDKDAYLPDKQGDTDIDDPDLFHQH